MFYAQKKPIQYVRYSIQVAGIKENVGVSIKLGDSMMARLNALTNNFSKFLYRISKNILLVYGQF